MFSLPSIWRQPPPPPTIWNTYEIVQQQHLFLMNDFFLFCLLVCFSNQGVKKRLHFTSEQYLGHSHSSLSVNGSWSLHIPISCANLITTVWLKGESVNLCPNTRTEPSVNGEERGQPKAFPQRHGVMDSWPTSKEQSTHEATASSPSLESSFLWFY